MDKLQRATSPSTWASLTSSTPCGSCVCFFSPQIIGGYASFLFHIGLLDERQRKYFQKQSKKCMKYIKEEKWLQAFEVSPGAHVARSNENHLRGPRSTPVLRLFVVVREGVSVMPSELRRETGDS